MSPVDTLSGAWLDPPAEFRSAPFWSWNARLEPDRLRRAIESIKAAGMGGFFMHSRYGLKTAYLSKEWFECISACVDKARQLGMKAYLYDEDRWPSGSAGGLITRENPEYRMHYLQARRGDERAGQSEEFLAAFETALDDNGRLVDYTPVDPANASGPEVIVFEVCAHRPSGWHNDGTYIDTTNGEAVDEFIHLTHQAYADRYGKDFGGLIPAIFTDEPNYFHPFHDGKGGKAATDTCPWTPELPREFIARRGYDLRDKLPELLLPQAGGEFSKVRHDYYRTLTELFVENFTARIGQWCDRHNIALTGHMLGEGTLAEQTRVIGAAMPHYVHMQWPGIDILRDQADELATAKQCSSVADQFGKARVLSELNGCTGWDWPLAGHKFVGDWQLACGVNLRCPHLTHYSLAGGGKRDYPASIFNHSPWWKYYSVVADYFARLCFMLTRGKPIRDVLVLHPIESAWGLYRHGAERQSPAASELDEAFRQVIYTLAGEHWDFDLGDESILAAHAKAAGANLKVGQMTYKAVVVPPCWTLRATTVSLLSQFLAGGGKVIFAGRAPTMIDAEPSGDLAKLIGQAESCGHEPTDLTAALRASLPRRVSITADRQQAQFIWHMLRAVEGGRLLFLQSHDRSDARDVHVSVAGAAPAVLWDALSGKWTKLAASVESGRVEFDLHLPAAGSGLVSLGLKIPQAADPPERIEVLDRRPIEGPWPIELSEPNTMPLDYCRLSFGDEDFRQPLPTIEADRRVRDRFGLSDRVGYGCQPWYLYATGKVDVSPRGRCRLLRTFNVAELPGKCAVAIERPEDFQITVNGKAVSEVAGWWVDEDIKTIDITQHLREGENKILQTFDYRPDMELEDLYLIGDFGTAKIDPSQPHQPGNIAITAAPNQLEAGSWVGQGLDFYGGAVRYRLSIHRPADRRVRLSLPNIACTAAAIHTGAETYPLPWPPFSVDLTGSLAEGANEVIVEVIGGRKNTLGPLHTPWVSWTGPAQFDPNDPHWQREYLLTDHGLLAPPVVEVLQ